MDDEQEKDGVRMFETKQGLVSIPASQKPVTPQEFFANDQLPESLKRFDIYQSASGPIVQERPLIAWTDDHDRKLEEIAKAARHSIDKNGYYLRQTSRHIKSLARGTEKPVQEAFDAFHEVFHDTYGQPPGQLVDEWRIGHGLPVTDRLPNQSINQEPEL